MPSLDKWKEMTPKDRDLFLKNPLTFTSYSDEDYELAENVAQDLRHNLNDKVGQITIANKGSYLIIEVHVKKNNYDFVTDKNIYNHLGFDISYYQEPDEGEKNF